MAAAMQQYQVANPINTNIRLEPVNSVDRLFVDRIGGSSPDTANGAPVLFPMTNPDGGVAQANAVPWTLADLTSYVIRNNGTGSQLVFGNTMTGVQEAEISNSVRFNDAIMSPDGRLVGYEINTTAAVQTDANSGIFHLLNSIGAPGTAANAVWINKPRQFGYSDLYNAAHGQWSSHSYLCSTADRPQRTVRGR